MNDTTPNQTPTPPDPLAGCTRPATLILGAVVAPIAAGLALGVAPVAGGAWLFGAFDLPPGADPCLAILFVLALITVLAAGILYVLSTKEAGV